MHFPIPSGHAFPSSPVLIGNAWLRESLALPSSLIPNLLLQKMIARESLSKDLALAIPTELSTIVVMIATSLFAFAVSYPTKCAGPKCRTQRRRYAAILFKVPMILSL